MTIDVSETVTVTDDTIVRFPGGIDDVIEVTDILGIT